MKNLLFFLTATLCFTLGSGCVKSVVNPDRCDSILFTDEVNPKLTAFQEAAATFSNDPTPANCAAYKAAGQEWLDAIRSFEDCSLIYTQTWRDAVDQAKADLADEPCN